MTERGRLHLEMDPSPPRLPPRLQQIVEVVSRLGEAAASDVLEHVATPLSNSAVRSMLQRLEAKGVLRKRVEGNRYLYRPAFSSSELRRALLLRLAEQHFDGSLFAVSVEVRSMMGEASDGDRAARLFSRSAERSAMPLSKSADTRNCRR